jgi:hypothetical protein
MNAIAGRTAVSWAGAFSLLLSVAGLTSAKAPTLCGADGALVARTIVHHDFRTPFEDAVLLALNDVHCDYRLGVRDTTHMANVVVATIVAGQRVYGIFHVHFTADGTLRSVAAVKPWRQVARDDGRDDWCNFIRVVYPAEAAVQGCEP